MTYADMVSDSSLIQRAFLTHHNTEHRQCVSLALTLPLRHVVSIRETEEGGRTIEIRKLITFRSHPQSRRVSDRFV